jgi:hypothetical protein
MAGLRWVGHRPCMGTNDLLLAQLLSLVGLLGATIEYIEIIGRRVVMRRVDAAQRALEASALPGMVRVLLADG